MGDIKKQKKKFTPPSHPWQKARIEEEKLLSKEFGLKTKTEIWKMNSILKGFYAQAKKLTKANTKQTEIEKEQLLLRLKAMGLLPADGKMEDVLTIKLKDVMGRRLQTLVYKKNLARSVNQARQFITHGHIFVGKNNITMPSHIVRIEDEASIVFKPNSSLASPDHPERAPVEKKEEKPAEKKEDKKKSSKKKAKPVENKEEKAPEAKKEEKKEEAKEEKAEEKK